jgi:hypothetical protein
VAALKTGWVPIRLVGNGAEMQVEWCWLGSRRFLEPFFENTIDHVQRLPFNSLFTHRTPMAELGDWHAASPGLPPAGFIFHMSRCGSTLVSQMLAALPENLVISEAGPLDRLARAAWLPEMTRAEWLRWMVSALGQKRAGLETKYFIKFDSISVAALPFIRRTFPDVPWIFIYRDGEEVLSSHLRQPAPAMSPGMITDAWVLDATVKEAMAMSPAEYAARVIGTLCRHAAQAMSFGGGMLVNYTQLPDAVWNDIARHFAVPLTPGDVDCMKQVARYNAKRPKGQFEPDGADKRSELSTQARTAATRWIEPYYAALSMRSCTSSPPVLRNPSRS